METKNLFLFTLILLLFILNIFLMDNWINEESGWMIKSRNGEYVNISINSPLSASSYIKLHDKWKNARKRLINIKNNENKCFVWCHIRYLNPLKMHPERITKQNKK